MSPAKGCVDNHIDDHSNNKISFAYSSLQTTTTAAENNQKDECSKKAIEFLATKYDENQPSTSSGLKIKFIEDKFKNEVYL